MIEAKARQMNERILTGKIDKMDAETKNKIRKERMAVRDEREMKELRVEKTNKYELLFPAFEEEEQQHYELLLKRANEIWDEFTTGAKGKKKADELKKEKEL